MKVHLVYCNNVIEPRRDENMLLFLVIYFEVSVNTNFYIRNIVQRVAKGNISVLCTTGDFIFST